LAETVGSSMTRLAKPEKKAGKGNERREIYAKA
jgi:hypothetical protein